MNIYKCKKQVMENCELRDVCDGTYNGTDCECAKDNHDFVPSTEDEEKTKALKTENEQLKQQIAEAMELLKLVEARGVIKDCDWCSHEYDYSCPRDNGTGKCEWRWQHADRYEKLLSEVPKDEV